MALQLSVVNKRINFGTTLAPRINLALKCDVISSPLCLTSQKNVVALLCHPGTFCATCAWLLCAKPFSINFAKCHHLSRTFGFFYHHLNFLKRHFVPPGDLHPVCLDERGRRTHDHGEPRLDRLHRAGLRVVLRRLHAAAHLGWNSMAG